MYMTKLQKAMAKWDGKVNTAEDVKRMRFDASLLVNKGISFNYFNKTFNPLLGKVTTVREARQFASDAAQGVGSFSPYAITQAWRRHNKED